MLKVKNQKVILQIAWTAYKAEKKRNFYAVLAIVLTSFLIASVLAVGTGYFGTLSQRQVRMQGMDYDIELSEPKEEQAEAVRALDLVRHAGLAVKCAVLEQYGDLQLDKTKLYWLDETCWEKQTVPALESYEGSYPQNENEIMLGTRVLKAMGIREPEIGMKLLFSYTVLAEDGGQELPEKEFVLCGWYTDYSGVHRGYISEKFYKTTGVKQTDLTQGALKITLKNPLYLEKDLKQLREAVKLEKSQYISADYDAAAVFFKMSAALAAVLVMVFASGYLFIYNTMYLSISKDIRYYGQLAAVGMTSAQIKWMVYVQAAWNALAGVPIGLAAAFFTAGLAVPQLVHIANPGFAASDTVSAKGWGFVLAGCFAAAVNGISCKKPAQLAADCPPAQALRHAAGMAESAKAAGKKRQHGVDCVTRSIIPSMAWQNLFRDKKQAAVIFCSFVIAISMFLVTNVLIRGNDAGRILNQMYSYDLRLKNETVLENGEQLLTDELISQIEAMEGIASVRKVASAKVIIPYQEDVYGEYLKELYGSRYSPGNYERDMELYQKDMDSNYFAPRMISVGKKGFELLGQSIETQLDWDAFENGETAIAVKYFTQGDNGMTGKTVRFSLPDGKHPQEEYTVQIAAAADGSANPAFFSGGILPDLVVSEAFARRLLKEPLTELIEIEYESAFSRQTEQRVRALFEKESRISSDSKLERYAEMKHTEMRVKILGAVLTGIFALMAVLNYLNMMAHGLQVRSREFAALESIGMTHKQAGAMLRLEGAGYAAISAGLSLAAGLPASYAVFCGMNRYQVAYSIPWISSLVLLAAVFILCMTVPVWIYQRTQNQSVVEKLRSLEG